MLKMCRNKFKTASNSESYVKYFILKMLLIRYRNPHFLHQEAGVHVLRHTGS